MTTAEILQLVTLVCGGIMAYEFYDMKTDIREVRNIIMKCKNCKPED